MVMNLNQQVMEIPKWNAAPTSFQAQVKGKSYPLELTLILGPSDNREYLIFWHLYGFVFAGLMEICSFVLRFLFV
jgi:hypothetical protein